VPARRIGSRPGAALLWALLAAVGCGSDTDPTQREGLEFGAEEGLRHIERLIAERQFAAGQATLEAILPQLVDDPGPLLRRLEAALLEGPLEGEFVSTMIATAGHLHERGAVTDAELLRLVTRGLPRVLTAGESEDSRKEAYVAAQRIGQVFTLAAAGNQQGASFERIVDQALALPATPSCDAFRAQVLGALHVGGDRIGSRVAAFLHQLPPRDPRREQLAIFVGRHLDLSDLLPFARKLGSGPGSSGAVVKVLSQYSFEREPFEVFATLMSFTEHPRMFGSDTLALGCAAWGRTWARKNAPGERYTELVGHMATFARTTGSSRTRSFATVALYGLLGHATEAPVRVDLDAASTAWIQNELDALGSEQTADDHRYHAHLAHCYGCVASDPEPLYAAWERCVENGQFSRASGLQVSLDLMRMRGVLSRKELARLRQFEEATLRPSDEIPTTALARKTLKIAFRGALPHLEDYCRLVLEAPRSDESLRRIARSYLDRAPDLRAWHARRQQKQAR